VGEELKLIEDAQRGSVDAFTELVGRYRAGLFRFLLTRCTRHADAEDALQDTLLNAFRYLRSYDPRWRFSTWLYRIAIRNAGRQHAPPGAELDELRDDGADPLAHCIADSDRDNLWRCARQRLSDDVFAAMWLRYVEDMSVRDIAAVLGRSTSWTKVNLLRGRRTLEAELNGAEQRTGNEAYG